MDELHLTADSNSFAASEFHSLGVFNDHMSHTLVCTPPYPSSLDSDVPGTGYLQDALFEFSSKRMRLSLFSDDQINHDETINFPIESCWRENYYPDSSFECLGQTNEIHCISAGRSKNNSSSESGKKSSGERVREKVQGAEEAIPAFQDSSSSSHTKYSPHLLFTPAPGGDHMEKKRKVIRRVVHPFAVVKSGGIEEGDITLDDINHRNLMPPTRPVRHPVGDFASRPFVFSGGRGLSGKAVVALTKIQTQGSGTITIIRTRGALSSLISQGMNRQSLCCLLAAYPTRLNLSSSNAHGGAHRSMQQDVRVEVIDIHNFSWICLKKDLFGPSISHACHL